MNVRTYSKMILICFCFRLLSFTQNYFKHVQSQGYNEVNDSRTIEKCGKKITQYIYVVDEFFEENEEASSDDDDDSWSSSKNL